MICIHSLVNNPIIEIAQLELTQQAASLGTPVTTALSSSTFVEIAPVGLVIPAEDGQTPDNNGGPGGIPGVDGNNGASMAFVMLTSIIIVLVMASASIFIA